MASVVAGHAAPRLLLREAPRHQGGGPPGRRGRSSSSSTRSTRSWARARPARGRRTRRTSSRPPSRRGEFPCIGATTHDEYRQHIEKDPALERRFSPVLVREPSVADTVTILQRARAALREAPRASATRPRRSRRPRPSRPATSPTASCPTRRSPCSTSPAPARPRAGGARGRTPQDVARTVAKMAGIPESRLLASDRERILGLEAGAPRARGRPRRADRARRARC